MSYIYQTTKIGIVAKIMQGAKVLAVGIGSNKWAAKYRADKMLARKVLGYEEVAA